MTKVLMKEVNKMENIMKKGSRWTKGKFDRVYFNIKDFGLRYSCYKTGNIQSAFWKGERISNSEAMRLLNVKCYLDLHTGEIIVQNADRTDISKEEIINSLNEYLYC